MKAKLTGRMLARTVEKQHKFSRGGVNKSGVARRREKKRGGERRNSGGYFWSVAARSTGRAWKDKSAAQ